MKGPTPIDLIRIRWRAEKESESMDINEPSLMDVARLNDTKELTPG